MSNNIALYIGRFQPFHLGHLDAINQIKVKGFEKIIIGIGSSQEERTSRNPFSYYERREMIDMVLRSKDIQYEFLSIPDFGDDKKWTEYILDNCLDFEKVFSGNPHVEKCFYGHKDFGNLEINESVKATNIRKNLGNKVSDWEELVPNEIVSFIKSKISQLEEVLRPELKTPLLAVDGIVQRGDSILLIERLNPPFGYALPGGFVDVGESCEDAVVRELKEEVDLDIESISLFGVYSDPKRDSRGHVASVVYVTKTSSNPLAGDDAKDYYWIKLDDIDNIQLAFDHRRIIEDYRRQLKC